MRVAIDETERALNRYVGQRVSTCRQMADMTQWVIQDGAWVRLRATRFVMVSSA